MAYRPTSFSPLRQPKGETTEQVGARLDRVQDNIRTQFDPLSKAVAALASSGTGGGGADLSDTPALALSTSAQAGTSDEASRSDHRHPLPSGSQLWTRQAVTTATALSGTGNIYVAITASFDGAITLPAATTANQTIVITDEAGVGSGDANGASENIIYVLCAGSDTITAPGLAAPRTRLMLWKRYGTITLVSDGTSSWKATARSYWHVDPRSIAGLEFWFDSRRGITLNGNAVSAWADLSGNNLDVAQGTAANQPQYIYSSNGSPRGLIGDVPNVQPSDLTDTLTSSGTMAVSSGSLALIGAYSYDWSRTAGTERLVQSAVTGSLGFFWSLNSSAPVGGATSGSMCFSANNAAGTSYQSVPRSFLTNGGLPQLAVIQFGAAATYRRLNRRNTGAGAFSASGAVSNFTQTIQVANSIVVGIMTLLAYDAYLAANDVFDLESAVHDVYLEGLPFL